MVGFFCCCFFSIQPLFHVLLSVSLFTLEKIPDCTVSTKSALVMFLWCDALVHRGLQLQVCLYKKKKIEEKDLYLQNLTILS